MISGTTIASPMKISQLYYYLKPTRNDVKTKNQGQIITEGKSQALVGAMPFCGEYLGPPFEDKFRSANQMDGISKAGGDKMATS